MRRKPRVPPALINNRRLYRPPPPFFIWSDGSYSFFLANSWKFFYINDTVGSYEGAD